jgi:8-oxo-dGTP pyrophosphatase MutT (NUDIX family)
MYEIPSHLVPPGLAERLDNQEPADVAPARPAATVVLLRDGEPGLELLLLRRGTGAVFMPGMFVFPGGQVDATDADPRLLARADAAADALRPEPRYRMAALREALEETGILLAHDVDAVRDAARDSELARWREALLRGEAGLFEVADALDVRLPAGALVYFANWVTPLTVPRRFDTHFFLTTVAADCQVLHDAREMSEAAWLTPAAALAANLAGSLPMGYPTIKTVEALSECDSAAGALAKFRDVAVEPRMGRLVRTRRGIAQTEP